MNVFSRLGAVRQVRVEDVAREAGVSPITVSRALGAPHKVRAETRERVMEAVQRTGYVVNPIASTLRSGRSPLVTMFVANLKNPHFANAMQGMLDAFRGSRYHLMFSQLPETEDITADLVESVLPYRPAAVAFTGLVRDETLRESLRGLGLPVMEMWDETDSPVDMLVASSAFDGGRLMGSHFVEHDFRRIAYCGHTTGRGAARLAGFREALGAAGKLVAHLEPIDGPKDFGVGMQAFERIVQALPDCDAIFFGSDLLAVGAVVAAARMGISIPGQIAIAGYGDLDFAAQITPSLTSINVGDYEIGRQAGQMLRRRLDGVPLPTRTARTPLRLEARRSTASS